MARSPARAVASAAWRPRAWRHGRTRRATRALLDGTGHERRSSCGRRLRPCARGRRRPAGRPAPRARRQRHPLAARVPRAGRGRIGSSPPTCPATAASRPATGVRRRRLARRADRARPARTPPAVVGYALGGAIAARFAARARRRVDRLVLVDALGLADVRAGAGVRRRDGGVPRRPDERPHDALWAPVRARPDPGCARRWARAGTPFRADNVERAGTRRLGRAGRPDGEFGLHAIRSASSSGIAAPTTLIWGRHDDATPLAVAEAVHAPPRLAAARHRGLRRRPRDRAARRVRARAARGARGRRGARRAGLPRRDRRTGREALRRATRGLQRHGRPPPGADRALRDAQRRRGGGRASRAATRLPVSVYAGGHNVTGNAVCDDGVTIDLRPMKAIAVDPAARTCRAGRRSHLGRARRRHAAARARRRPAAGCRRRASAG